MTVRSLWIALVGVACGDVCLLAAQEAPPDTVSSVAPPDTVASAVILSRDALSGATSIRGDWLRFLPIDDVRQVLILAPGVLARGAGLGVGGAVDVSLRGAPAGEASVYIDGAPVRIQTFGAQGITLGTNAIADITVTTGLAPVAMGDVRSGVIAYTMASGGPRIAGHFRAETDEAFGAGSTVGYNRFEGALGGPVPGSGITWFAAASLQGQGSQYRGLGAADLPAYAVGGVDTVAASITVPQFIQVGGECGATGGFANAAARDIRANYGASCDGLRRPMDWTTSRRLLGKVAYRYGSGSSLTVTGLTDDAQQRGYPGGAIGAPSLYLGARSWSRLGALNLRHQLGALPVAVDAHVSMGSDNMIRGPLDPQSELETRAPALGIEFGTLQFAGLDVFPFPVTEAIVRNWRTGGGLRTPYQDRLDLSNAQPYRLNPYGVVSGWPTTGLDAYLTLLSERRLTARGSVEWSGAPGHRIVLGAETGRTDVAYYDANMLAVFFAEVLVLAPRQFGVFLSDRMALGDVELEIGARVDRVNGGGSYATTPGFIRSHPQWNSAAGTDDTAYANSVARVMQSSRWQTLFTPRVRARVPLGERTDVRFAFGRQAELPSLARLFANANGDVTYTISSEAFGRDVDYAAATIIEAGVQHRLGRLVVDVSGYSRTPGTAYALRPRNLVSPLYDTDTMSINVLARVDEGSVRGLDLQVLGGHEQWVAGAAYSLILNQFIVEPPPPGTVPAVPPKTFATHGITAFAILRGPQESRDRRFIGRQLQGFAASTVLRVLSGQAYTPLQNLGLGEIAPGGFVWPQEVSRLPWTRHLDLRVERKARMGRVEWTAFADVRNVLGLRNTTRLFAETGDVVNQKYKQTIIGDPDRATGEYGVLWAEAQDAGALLPGNAVDLASCAGWSQVVNCVALQRVEQRFGDGDAVYTLAEQQRALDTMYDSFFGAWRFYEPGRTARLGLQVAF